MIFSQLLDDPTVINTLGVYHPYRGGNNEKFDDFSSKILNLKNNKIPGLAYFYRALEAVLADDNYTIITVPSHNPENTTSGMKTLVKMLCENSKRVDGTECLIRHTLIAKAATGGARSIPIHLNSIRVANLNLISGKEVLLLDDVSTTHSSLLACQQLIQRHTPKLVVAYALAQTAPNT